MKIKIYQIIIIIVIVLFFIFHSYYSLKVNNNTEILQLHQPTKTILEENLNQKLPLIITGIMDNWDFVKELDLDLLKTNYGTKRVTINNSIIEQEQTKKITQSFSSYIDWLHQLDTSTQYNQAKLLKKIKDTKLNTYLAENEDLLNNTKLIEQIKKETKILNSPLTLVNTYPLWIGHGYSKTGLHYDTDTRNFLCQIKGQKKIYLFPPNQSKYLYPSKKYENGAVCSQVNFWNIESQKFPLFSQSQYIEIILSPGQILYIPPYWWHCVENIDTNISISVRSEPISTLFIKIPELLKLIAHRIKLYGNHNCTCCNN